MRTRNRMMMTTTNDDNTINDATDAADAIREVLVEIAAEGLAFCQKKSVIKRKLNAVMYGIDDETGEPKRRMHAAGIEKILSKARKHLQMRAAVTAVEAREDSIGFYENIISDDEQQGASRIRCRENLDKLMGIAVPDVSIVAQAKKKVSLRDLGLDLKARKAALEKLRADRLLAEIAL